MKSIRRRSSPEILPICSEEFRKARDEKLNSHVNQWLETRGVDRIPEQDPPRVSQSTANSLNPVTDGESNRRNYSTQNEILQTFSQTHSTRVNNERRKGSIPATSQNSRMVLNERKIVHQMKSKWEEYIKQRGERGQPFPQKKPSRIWQPPKILASIPEKDPCVEGPEKVPTHHVIQFPPSKSTVWSNESIKTIKRRESPSNLNQTSSNTNSRLKIEQLESGARPSDAANPSSNNPTTLQTDEEKLQKLSEEYDNLTVSPNREKSWSIGESVQKTNASASTTESQLSIVTLGSIPLREDQTELRLSQSKQFGVRFEWRVTDLIKRVSELKLTIEEMRRMSCRQCGGHFSKGEKAIQNPDGNSYWHPNHFLCKRCSKPLLNCSHYFYEGDVYCSDHFGSTSHAPVCNGCGERILKERYTFASGLTWHQEHFCCSLCSIPLVETKFVAVPRKVYCFPCHEREYRKVCSTCKRIIKPYHTFVQSENNYWHARSTCLTCSTCRKSLLGGNHIYNRKGVLYCNRYCASLKKPPV